MEFFELIEKRHSVRSYKPDAIETEILNKVLKAAVLAPTAANRQAFRVFVIKTKEHEQELRSVYGREWFVKAPVVLAVCTMPGETWVRSDGKNYSDVDAAIVMDHIILAASELGLGTCWVGAFSPKAAREMLRLQDDVEPVAFTTLGYPHEESIRPKVRKSPDDLITYL